MIHNLRMNTNQENRKAYFIGGGIGSLAGAVFLIRDAGISGKNITIFESLPHLGGSLDAFGNPENGYIMRGARMLTMNIYECTWALFKTIPSLTDPTKTVYEETIAFNDRVKSNAKARLIDKNRAIIDASKLGFSITDRIELLKLSEASEDKLDNTTISDWLSPSFFETNFWFMWRTTFAFSPWHSAIEFKRYLHRFMQEFAEVETMTGVRRTVYNQYDSMVRPLEVWLELQSVNFRNNCTVTDLHTEINDDQEILASSIEYQEAEKSHQITVHKNDLVFYQNGSMTDAYSFGSMKNAPKPLTKKTSKGWEIWEKLAKKHSGFGNPAVFNSSIPETAWESFTVTLKDTAFFDKMEAFSGNKSGTGSQVTLKDSNWFLSFALNSQPHYSNQPSNVQVFWAYGLHPDRVGNFVGKPMTECSGEEILQELCGHLKFDYDTVFGNAICIPCRMPYITSMFMPRKKDDRPLPVPKKSKNLAFISQFVEIPDDVVFTVEYSIRAAQMAVYELLNIDLKIPPIAPHDKTLKVKMETIIKAFE
ncbi:oleate hydratase [Flavobacterium psychrophilum]|uniref:oleate hydratase n=2 Tax=Flavobacterium psychrophilum TaxID=96345 RepID=UPI001D05C4FE|nr:oleate hydratase [Flavobacterium psychrophilum]MCB5986018.1 oleate hydratase [Flavobacterium psychrophilum]MEB3388826.1 oleate hydratase [Flavobacterium psychrophilum]MEB3396418.1 oleate hydratase [Flavobacterium psychrophilum]MEB3403190.1 oleate hydratase [Flavobacterium psychrophilum]